MKSDEPQPRVDLEEELRVAVATAREAGAILLSHFHAGSETWEKSKDNPVTAADLEADAAIRARLAEAFPRDGLLSEETPDDEVRVHHERCWIVDPMDGTKEFTQGRAEFSVSIALALESEPVVGVVFNPVVDVLYAARRGGGCTRNGEPAQVSACDRLTRARACASRTEISKGRLDGHRDWFASLDAIGSIAWKLALVAGGELDVNVSMRPKHEWDVCAGDVLVREAGGRYIDFRGEPRRYNQQDPVSDSPMIASSPALLHEFLERQAAS